MRKLATAALPFSAAIFAAYYWIPPGRLIVPAVLSAATAAALALLRRKWLRGACLALLFFSLGLLHFSLYREATLVRAESCAGRSAEVTARVLDEVERYPGYQRVTVRIVGGELPHFQAVLYDESASLSPVRPGDLLTLTARVRTADTLYGKPYNNYIGRGVYFRLRAEGEISCQPACTIESLPVRFHTLLLERMDSVFPSDVRPFVKALLLGDKDSFYADDGMYVAMTGAGLMHVVAVSGLHVAFLVSILQALLGRGKLGTLVSLAVVWLFVLVTGSGKAALRAGFMLSLLLMAPILRRENDPITSLSAILGLCLCVNPYAAGSVGLQLSYAAMAGLMLFYAPLYRRLSALLPMEHPPKALRFLLSTLCSSFAVMPFTVPLTAIHFGYVPLLAVAANLLCLWAVSFCFGLGWLACLLSFVPVLGSCVAWADALLVRYILLCAKLVAALPFSVLYTATRGAWLWLLVSYLLPLLTLLLRKRRLWRVLLPAALSLSLLAAVLLWARVDSRRTESVHVLDVGQGQCIAAYAGDTTVVVDCGNSFSLDNAGSLAAETLRSQGRDRVDVLLLTHLHADHANGAVRLMESLPVGTLVLPKDADDSDSLRQKILACAKKHAVEVREVDRSAALEAGEITMELTRLSGEAENERCLMGLLHAGELSVLITADAPREVERRLVRDCDLSGANVLIVGHHGAKNASDPALLREVGGGIAVISTGYNSYGHPAEETLEALRANGYTVYRTDLNGSITIRAGDENG